EFENFDENCLENNVDNTNDKKDEDYQLKLSSPYHGDDTVNYGSKLWARDENTRNYRIMQGIPRSIKFRSINNLYQ
ncbi:hypothetical protein HAX54_000191, partial [Datura stramonium]|nr:hypothetical protein [Datura stramonium]